MTKIYVNNVRMNMMRVMTNELLTTRSINQVSVIPEILLNLEEYTQCIKLM